MQAIKGNAVADASCLNDRYKNKYEANSVKDRPISSNKQTMAVLLRKQDRLKFGVQGRPTDLIILQTSEHTQWTP